MPESTLTNSLFVMGLLALLCGAILYTASRFFTVEGTETLSQLIERLPGANCGSCGFGGCAAYARALVEGKSTVGACRAMDEVKSREIAALLGLQIDFTGRPHAVVLCQGGEGVSRKNVQYIGIKSCKVASIYFGGDKVCEYACLGYGDCSRVCPFSAIRMDDKGIPQVDLEKCVGCGICKDECPKKVIGLLSRDSHFIVACASRHTGKQVAKICKKGCIACKRCEKACKENAILVNENLAKIDPDRCKNCGSCYEVCPTRSIVKI
ncbi:MAG: RnfABCDGE type electron transport complex subunit B [Deltaproteobacteria bacterium]|nr:RnfABCDGE type electron transport complex subunit B [Deltaproteobacteria bacterium]